MLATLSFDDKVVAVVDADNEVEDPAVVPTDEVGVAVRVWLNELPVEGIVKGAIRVMVIVVSPVLVLTPVTVEVLSRVREIVFVITSVFVFTGDVVGDVSVTVPTGSVMVVVLDTVFTGRVVVDVLVVVSSVTKVVVPVVVLKGMVVVP